MATTAQYSVSKPTTSKPWKCLYVVMVLAFLVNFVLVLAVGGGLYYHQQRISDVDNKVSLLDAAVGNGNGGVSSQVANTNTTGSPGPPGPAGESGPKGDPGDAVQGPKGDPGDIGVRGSKGDTGDAGAIGPAGLTGPTGSQGETGQQGPLGPAGLMGLQGATGQQGPTGPMGFKGDRGDQGVTGQTGAIGAQGMKGEKGTQGEQGMQGTQGPIGLPAPNQATIVYNRWGSATCPSVTGTQLVYTGLTAGSFYTHSGGGSNYICIPLNPQYGRFRAGFQNQGVLFGTEYEDPIVGSQNHNAPCAVCLATTRGAMLMLPGRTTCPTSWTAEYTGFLMTDHRVHSRTHYVCVDNSQSSATGSFANLNGALFYHVEVDCGYGLPCPPFIEEKELTCVVCTK